jgi:hypothetical protein
MSLFLTDTEIADLISEEKQIATPLSKLGSRFRPKKNHREADIAIPRADGSQFKIIIRQSALNPMDFSVILGYVPAGSNEVFLLRRYNGKSHTHSNKLERTGPFYDFHIHTATERYQLEGLRPEYYAEPTARYSDLSSAIDCMIADCNIVSNNEENRLFN